MECNYLYVLHGNGLSLVLERRNSESRPKTNMFFYVGVCLNVIGNILNIHKS